MYCSNCGNALTSGLSYCNRCGTHLRERVQTKSNTASIGALVTAITVLGVVGLGIMMGGAVVLKEAGLPTSLIGFFMLFTFLILGITELMLVRSVSRLTGTQDGRQQEFVVSQPPLELRPPAARTFGEQVSSVTENTTRTLEHSRRES